MTTETPHKKKSKPMIYNQIHLKHIAHPRLSFVKRFKRKFFFYLPHSETFTPMTISSKAETFEIQKKLTQAIQKYHAPTIQIEDPSVRRFLESINDANFQKKMIQQALYEAYQAYKSVLSKKNPSLDEKRLIKDTVDTLKKNVKKIKKRTPLSAHEINELEYINGIREAEIGLLCLKKTLSDQKTPYLSSLSSDQIWNLFIDGNTLGRTPYIFDVDEPGYLGGLFHSLNYALTKNKKITTKFIKKIHRLAMNEVVTETGTSHAGYRPAKYLGTINLLEFNSTPEGIKELYQKILKNDPSPGTGFFPHLYIRTSAKDREIRQLVIETSKIKPEIYLQRLIDNFETELNSADNNNDKKQQAIVRFIQNLNQAHLFTDGNIRTVGFVLLNVLLIRESLTPVFWDNPNILDAHSFEQCCEQVKKGQSNFLTLLTENTCTTHHDQSPLDSDSQNCGETLPKLVEEAIKESNNSETASDTP